MEVAIGLVTATTAPAAHQLWDEARIMFSLVAQFWGPIIMETAPPLRVENHTILIRIEANICHGIGALDADCLSDAEDSSSEGCLDHVFVSELLFAMNVLF